MVYVIDEKVNPGTAVRALLYTDAVSYTHLDVYKRQSLMAPIKALRLSVARSRRKSKDSSAELLTA